MTRGRRQPGRVRHPLAVIIFAVVMVAAACGPDEPQAGPSTSGDPARGAEVYAANCASCHGADLRGTDKGPSHLSIVYEPGHHGDASFRSAIANGSPQHHWEFGDMEPTPRRGNARPPAAYDAPTSSRCSWGLIPRTRLNAVLSA